MSGTTKAAVIREDFRRFLEDERAQPVQCNLFTGETESVRVDVSAEIPDDETVVDEGISIVKTDDAAQLIVSGFGLYLGKRANA